MLINFIFRDWGKFSPENHFQACRQLLARVRIIVKMRLVSVIGLEEVEGWVEWSGVEGRIWGSYINWSRVDGVQLRSGWRVVVGRVEGMEGMEGVDCDIYETNNIFALPSNRTHPGLDINSSSLTTTKIYPGTSHGTYMYIVYNSTWMFLAKQGIIIGRWLANCFNTSMEI